MTDTLNCSVNVGAFNAVDRKSQTGGVLRENPLWSPPEWAGCLSQGHTAGKWQSLFSCFCFGWERWERGSSSYASLTGGSRIFQQRLTV